MFGEAVLRVVRSIPSGKVVSYGQVAAYVGAPRAARQVGWAMSSMEHEADFPWWRVVNNAGKITIRGNQVTYADLQRELLRKEGVEVNDAFELSIERYRFRPTDEQLLKLGIDTQTIGILLEKYSQDS